MELRKSHATLTDLPMCPVNMPYYSGPLLSLWSRPPRTLTRCTFKAYLLIFLYQAALGIRSSQTYSFVLATRSLLHVDPRRHHALSWIRNLLATHFRQCTFVGPYIRFLSDLFLPRSNLRICLSISAWRVTLPMPDVHSLLQSLHQTPRFPVVATTSYTTSRHQERLLSFMAVLSILIASSPAKLQQHSGNYNLLLLRSYAWSDCYL